MVPVVGGPVEFVVPVALVDGVLRLVPGGIDKCERLAHGRLLSNCRTFPSDWLPGLRFGIERKNRRGGCNFRARRTDEKSSRDANKFRPDRSISVRLPKVRESCKFFAGFHGDPVFPGGRDCKMRAGFRACFRWGGAAGFRLTSRLDSSTFEAD